MREVKNPIKGVSKKGLGIGRWSSYITLTIFFATYIIFVVATPQVAPAAVFNCSTVTCLKNRINQANSTAVADTINLAAGTYTLTQVNNRTDEANGLPSITSKITIKGAGANATIIKRSASAPSFRIFYIDDTGNLTLEGLTVRNGSEGGRGGGIFNNGGTLNITRSIVTDNLSDEGGGISNDNGGTAIITSTTVTDNNSIFGGIFNDSDSTMTIIRSTVNSNVADEGGGIFNEGGTMTIISSTIAGNGALDSGEVSATAPRVTY